MIFRAFEQIKSSKKDLHTKEELYSNKIFFNAALPLVKVIANDVPSLKKQFAHVHAIIQVSAKDPDAPGGKVGMHFVVNSDEWLVHLNKVDPNPHVELEFKSVEAMNAFFKGKMSPATLPKMKGVVTHFGAFKAFLMTLLKMSSLLGATEAPKDEATKELMVKCFFYLLSSGIASSTRWVTRIFTTGPARAPTVFMHGRLTVIRRFPRIYALKPASQEQAEAIISVLCRSSPCALTTLTVRSEYSSAQMICLRR